MGFPHLCRSVRKLLAGARRSRALAPRPFARTVLGLELFEERLTPALVTWTGAGDGTSWSAGANWSTGVVPGVNDNVVINSETATVNHTGADTVNSVTVSAGTLNNSGSLTATQGITLAGSFNGIDNTGTLTDNGTFTWTNGGLSGAGTTVLNGASNLSGGFSSPLTDQQVQNNGTATISDGNSIDFSGNAVWNNETGSTFILQGSGSISTFFASSTSAFNNFGTVDVTAGASSTSTAGIGVPFNNSGTVDVRAGTLSLGSNGTGGTGGGTFTVESGAALVANNYTLQNATVTGAGTFQTDSLTVSATSSIQNMTITGLVTAAAALEVQNLTFSGGELAGPANVTVGDTFDWTGGTLGGTGVLILDGTSTIDGSFSSPISQTVDNYGTASVVAGSTQYFEDGAIWNNESGSTFILPETATLTTFFSNSVFNNAGTVDVTAPSGTTSIGLPFSSLLFNNTGTVDVQTGTLDISGGTGSGTFTVESGAVLSIGTYTLQSATVTGAGAFQATGGLTVDGTTSMQNMTVTGGTVTINGPLGIQTLIVDNGTVTASAAVTATNMTVTGGTMTASAVLTATNLIIDGGGLTATSAGVLNLTLSSGALTNSGTITVADTFDWTGGTLNGTGDTILDGTSALAGSSLALAGQVDNFGTASVTAGTTVGFQNNTTWNNDAGGTFILPDSAGLSGSSTAVFNNAGTFEKTAPTGTATVSLTFNNTGLVDVQTGTLNLTGAGTGTGTFTIESGATLSESRYTLQNATVSGAGTFQSTGLTVSGTSSVQNMTVTGGTVTANAALTATNLTLTGGALTGPANVTVAGTFNWTGGTLGGTGDTILDGTSTLATSAALGREVDNYGTASVTPGTTVSFQNNTTWNNDAGGTFILPDSAGLSGSSTSVFNNAGTFEKTAPAGTATVSLTFNNTGLVDVQTGTLNLTGAGTGGGTFTIESGATLSESRYTLQNATVTGAGTFQSTGLTVSGTSSIQNMTVTSGTVTINGPLGVQALIVNGGTVTASAAVNATNMTIAGGTVTANAALNASNLTFSSGTLAGSGTITVAGNFDWTGGALSGTGATVLDGTSALDGSSPLALATQVNNFGTASVANGTQLRFNTNAIWNNEVGGTFILPDTAGLSRSSSTSAFNNAGTFEKTAPTGTATVGVTFNNTGLVDVQAGTLNLSTGGTGSGTFTLESGATLSESNYTLQNATVTGAGTFQSTGLTVSANSSIQNLTFTGGTLTGSGTITVAGNFDWTGGALSGTGDTVLNGTSTLATSAALGREVDNFGTASVTPGTTVNVQNNTTWNNDAGGTFILPDSAGLSGASTAVFNNAGTFEKTAPAGTATVSLTFNNTGLVDVQTGTLNLTGGGTGSSTFTIESGATLSESRYTLQNATVTGAGTFQSTGLTVSGTSSIQNMTITGGTVTANAALNATNLTLTGGTLTGSGTITVAGTFNWTGGTLSGTGDTVLDGTSTLATSAALGREVDNFGTASVAPGTTVNVQNNTTWNNDAGGTFILPDSAGLSGSSTAVFNNAGTFEKTAPTGTATVSLTFNNTGLVDVQTGTLNLTGGGTGSSTFTIESGATLSESRYTLQNATVSGAGTFQSTGLTISGNSSVQNMTVTGGTVTANAALNATNLTLTGGTLTGPANVTVAGTFNWTGGTLSGTGDTVLDGTSTLATSAALGREVDNFGTASVAPGTTVNVQNNTTWNNDAGGTFILPDSAGLSGSSTAVFNNAGTFEKTAPTGTATVSLTFNNTGLVDVQTGTLNLTGAGTGSSTFTIEAGAVLAAGNYTLQNATITGAGSVQVGTFNSLTVAAASSIQNLTVNGGTVTANDSLAVQNLTLSNGTLTGPANVTVDDNFDWTGGALDGTGDLILDGTSTIDGSFASPIAQEVDNYGTASVVAGSTQYFENNAIWNNESGSTFILPGTVSLTAFFSGGSKFNNAGTVEVTAPSGTASIGLPLNNTGTIEVDAGTLLTAAAFSNAGTVTVGSGNTFTAPGGYTQTGGATTIDGTLASNDAVAINGGSLTGSGVINAGVTNAGSITPGDSGPGVLTINGTYTQTSAGALNIQIGGTTAGSGYGQLAVSGPASLAGALNVTDLNNFVPDAGDTFEVMAFASNTGTFDTFNGLNFGNGRVLQPAFTAGDTGLDLTTFIATTTTLTSGSSGNSSVYGQDATFTATVGADDGNTPNGSVQFQINGANVGTPVNLVGGTATFDAGILPAGAYQVTVVYNPVGFDLASTSAPLTYTVNPDPTTTALTSSAAITAVGQSVTFTATVTANAPGSGTPTGSVSFFDGSTLLGTVNLPAGGPDQVNLTTSALAAGTHTITAVYSGDNNFVTSTSAGASEVILGPGVAVFGTSLYVVGADTADDIQINPVGASGTGSTGLQVNALLNNVWNSQTFAQPFTDVHIFGDNGNDTVQMASTLTVNAFVTEGDGTNYIQTAGGDDVITVGRGSNTIFSGNGDKTITAQDATGTSDFVQLGTGTDTVALGAGNDQVVLSNGTNTVTAGDGNDAVQTGDGNNTITLGNGTEYVHTGNGADAITVGNGTATVLTGTGDKTITAGNGNDYVQTGTGTDAVTLGNGNDTVLLGDGANTITLGGGRDFVQAGSGDNTVTVGDGNGDTILVGNGDNVVVTGNGNGDFVQAGNGDNLIAAGTGAHTVIAGNGSNILIDGSVALTQPGDSLRQVLEDWKANGANPADVADIHARLLVTDNTSNANYLAAGSGLDWFWETFAQDQTNRKPTDLLN